MFASDSGVVHPAHCLTRGYVAFFAGDAQLAYALWTTADKIEVRVRGHKGDQDMIGSVRVRTPRRDNGSAFGLSCRRRRRGPYGGVDVVPSESAR